MSVKLFSIHPPHSSPGSEAQRGVMIEGWTGNILAKNGWENGFLYIFFTKKAIKLEFSINATSDQIGRDMSQRSDIPGCGWVGDG